MKTTSTLARIFHPILLREGQVLCLAASNGTIRSSTYSNALPVESVVFLARQVFTSARDETDEISGLDGLFEFDPNLLARLVKEITGQDGPAGTILPVAPPAAGGGATGSRQVGQWRLAGNRIPPPDELDRAFPSNSNSRLLFQLLLWNRIGRDRAHRSVFLTPARGVPPNGESKPRDAFPNGMRQEYGRDGIRGPSVWKKTLNKLRTFFDRRIWRHSFRRMLAMLVLLWVTATVALFYTEGPSNPGFDSLHEVLWNIVVYFFSGLDSAQPETISGQVIVTLVLAISVGIVAIFTGMIASFLVEHRIGNRRRMPKYNLSDHIVVCNWNSKAIPIIRELHAEIIKDKRPIVVVSEHADAAELPEQDDDPVFDDVFLVKGDPANEIVLKRACVRNAYSVLILADPTEGHLADAKSILIAMAIRASCSDSRPVHISVEGVDPGNREHLKRAGVEEIVGASEFAMMLLAQSSLAHGLSVVYHDLLDVTNDTNEIYLLLVPDSFVGKTFGELGAAMFEHRMTGNPAIPIGVINQEGIVINPHPSQTPQFAKGDQIIVIAFERPDQLVPPFGS